MPTALKKHQRMELAQLARAAWTRAAGRGEGRAFDQWRHDEVQAECGKRGLTCCNQDDYAGLKARFLDGCGAVAEAFKWRMRAQSQQTRVIRWRLDQALLKAGLAESYAAAICRDEFKCALAEASARQLLSLCYTINSRAKSARKEPVPAGASEDPDWSVA